jgi:hypothetical protein
VAKTSVDKDSSFICRWALIMCGLKGHNIPLDPLGALFPSIGECKWRS